MNPVVHFEIPGEDMERMKKFYETAFKWKVNQMGADMGNYVVVQTDETDEKGMLKKTNRINGGLYKRGEHTSPAPSVVIAVTDIAKAMEDIKAAGGTVTSEAMPIPGVGNFFTFTDTEGNRLSALQPNEQM